MFARSIILATLVASSLLTTACLKEVADSLTEVRRVHEALTREFGENVFVNIYDDANRRTLNVSFINSALNNRSQEERAARAQRTAAIIRQTYPRINSLNTIWINFVSQETHYVFFHRSQMIDYFGFYKDGKLFTSRSDPPATTGSGVQLEVNATYSRNRNESDVLLNGIQLEGEPGGFGITVLPHYTVAGDVRARRARPPEAVAFDFRSYSDKPVFRETEPITFLADKKPVLQTTGYFFGTDVQSCTLLVPYAAFTKMIAAQQLTIKLGAKSYQLQPSEFAAMQRMGEYVK